MPEHKITIATSPKFRPIRLALSVATQVGVIGLGVLADSAAMQWAGFIVLSLVFIALAVRDKTAGLTFDEARKAIDRLEAEST